MEKKTAKQRNCSAIDLFITFIHITWTLTLNRPNIFSLAHGSLIPNADFFLIFLLETKLLTFIIQKSRAISHRWIVYTKRLNQCNSIQPVCGCIIWRLNLSSIQYFFVIFVEINQMCQRYRTFLFNKYCFFL